MGRRKKNQEEQSSPNQTAEGQDISVEHTSQQNEESEEPERFDRSLLSLSIAERLDYFEKYRMDHTRLSDALDKILHAICSPGDSPDLKRPGTIVLVIGPTRVGKTTLIGELEKRLYDRARERMLRDPGFMPFASVTTSGQGRFDWIDFSKDVLRQFKDPFVDRRSTLVRGRDFQEAMIEAYIHRQPYAVIVDEAQHLAKAARGSSLQAQLDQLKYYENRTGVSHVLVGTYEMRPFRKASAQLACRSIDVHFPRYDAMEEKDRALFKSILWALQCQLPVEKEPPLVEKHWEFLYARSIGCIGLLKVHLNDALELALHEGAKTITEAHLKATAMHKDRIKLAFTAAIQGENDLSEGDDADEELLEMIRESKKSDKPQKRQAQNVQKEGQDQPASTTSPKTNKPGNRLPSRDPIGVNSEVEDLDNAVNVAEDQAVG